MTSRQSGNIRELLLNCLWHSRQFAIDDSPRTETMPGAGYLVEHSEHVGMNTLLNVNTILEDDRSAAPRHKLPW
jgi:hypothetical protein